MNNYCVVTVIAVNYFLVRAVLIINTYCVHVLVLVDDELFSCSAVGAHIFLVSIQSVLEAVD